MPARLCRSIAYENSLTEKKGPFTHGPRRPARKRELKPSEGAELRGERGEIHACKRGKESPQSATGTTARRAPKKRNELSTTVDQTRRRPGLGLAHGAVQKRAFRRGYGQKKNEPGTSSSARSKRLE